VTPFYVYLLSWIAVARLSASIDTRIVYFGIYGFRLDMKNKADNAKNALSGKQFMP
jgi:hypothetical protein